MRETGNPGMQREPVHNILLAHGVGGSFRASGDIATHWHKAYVLQNRYNEGAQTNGQAFSSGGSTG